MNKLIIFAFFLFISLTFSKTLKKKVEEFSLASVESQTSAPCTDDPANCIPYWLDNQVVCTQSGTLSATRNAVWGTLNNNADFKNLGVRIMAYRIQWFNGSWSEWYFPGFNDLDWKAMTINGKKYLRRVWAYFGDHNYMYVTCK